MEDTFRVKVEEYADLYTGMDPYYLTQHLQEMKQSDLPDKRNLSLASIPNEGKVVLVSYNDVDRQLYYMLRNNSGEWCILQSEPYDADLPKMVERYTFRTGVQKPAIYYNQSDLYGASKNIRRTETYLFDVNSDECLIMNMDGDFYHSDQIIQNWYDGWMQSIDNEPYHYFLGKNWTLESFHLKELKQAHPKMWVDILTGALWIIGIGLIVLIGILIALKCQGGNMAWVEKIPLSHRMMTGMSRYIK